MNSIHKLVILLALCSFLTNCQREDESNSDDETWITEFIGSLDGYTAINSISVHPEVENLWFVTSWNGIYITRDGGDTWENYFSDFTPAVEIDPIDPSNILVGSLTELYFSKDYGKSWTALKTFEKTIESLLIREVDQSFLVGLRWEDSEVANGIYKSENQGTSWTHFSYGTHSTGLIPWDIEEDPMNDVIYIATEIYDHPSPYKPPFLRSMDGGETWEDISVGLPWHAIKIQIHPDTRDVYVLTEGAGLFYSGNFGNDWEKLSNYFWLEFIIDKNNPDKFFGGNHTANSSGGGVYYSKDKGHLFSQIALKNHIVGSLCFDVHSNALYVASYGSGIYRIVQN